MKKFTKISLIIATVMVVVGVFCLIGSVALGLTWGRFADMVKAGKFSFNVDLDIGENNSFEEVTETCKNLDIELGAGVLEIYYGDVENIQIEQEDVPNFKSYIEDDTLHIEGGVRIGINTSGGKIALVLPKGMTFDEIELEVGAGEADVEGLTANSVNIEVGAGEADISKLDVKELNAEVGAGELYVKLVGKETDYSYDIECGIGEIQIGDNSYGGLGRTKNITNSGSTRFLDIECGVGEIQIEFQEK